MFDREGRMTCAVPMTTETLDLEKLTGIQEELLAERRRDAENVLLCWGIDPELIEKTLAGFTLDHVLLVPEQTYNAMPALQELAYIKPLPPSITDRVIAVKDEMAGLRRFGTPATYPHKQATKLIDMIGWGDDA